MPVGLKDPRLIGAYKTPTLRSLERTGPYQHNGGLNNLREAVAFYNHGGTWNQHLDAWLRDEKDLSLPRDLGLDPSDIDALVLFLRALNGADVDGFVKAPPGKE